MTLDMGRAEDRYPTILGPDTHAVSRRQATEARPESSAAAPTSEPQSGPAVAVVEVLPPAGRRTTTALLVRSCPTCRHAHLHRGDVGERRPSCGGPSYLLATPDGAVIA